MGLHGNHECYTYNEKTGNEEYDLHYTNQGDVASSIDIPEGVTVRLYHDLQAGGDFDEYSGPAYYNGLDANDVYSWIQVCRGPCPEATVTISSEPQKISFLID